MRDEPWENVFGILGLVAILAELGYVRDPSAAGLRRGPTMTIGVVPRLACTVTAMLSEALAHAVQRSGHVTIAATTDEPPADRAAVETPLQRRVDVLVLAAARLGDDSVGELAARGVPYVLALRTDGDSLASVGGDRLGGHLATRHLIDLGHRRIGSIAGPDHASSARGRREGYRQAMAEAGIDVDPAWVAESTFGIAAGADPARTPMSLDPRPTAVFAVNAPRRMVIGGGRVLSTHDHEGRIPNGKERR